MITKIKLLSFLTLFSFFFLSGATFAKQDTELIKLSENDKQIHYLITDTAQTLPNGNVRYKEYVRVLTSGKSAIEFVEINCFDFTTKTLQIVLYDDQYATVNPIIVPIKESTNQFRPIHPNGSYDIARQTLCN